MYIVLYAMVYAVCTTLFYVALKLINQNSSVKWSVASADFKVTCLKSSW